MKAASSLQLNKRSLEEMKFPEIRQVLAVRRKF